MHFGPAVFAIAKSPRILDVVEQLIGREITSNPILHVRINSPERAVPQDAACAHVISTDWHQDMGVTLEEADETPMVTVWLSNTDAALEHDCLQNLSGQ